MKNAFAKIFILFMIFFIVSPNHILAMDDSSNLTNGGSLVDESMNPEVIKNIDVEKLQTKSAFEKAITMFFLSVGDYAHDFLTQLFKEELTIDKIVYNDAVMLNANFFEKSPNNASSNASVIVREFINTWFDFFQKITLVVIMAVIVLAGIKILLHTPGAKVSAYESLKKIFMAVVLIYFFPYVMRYAFDINEGIINIIRSEINPVNQTAGAAISQISDLKMDELEFRSPQYVSLAGLRVSAGSTEANELYLNRIEQYAASADIMRLMRAMAGVTLRFMYVILWYIMLAQTYILVVIYIKRYIVIAFLTVIYPLVIVGYVTGGMLGKSHNAFNAWCSKYFSNIFLQTLHAIIYGVISGVIVSQVRNAMVQSALTDINWLLMIIATSFLFSAEKILTKFWKASIDTSERSGIKKFFGAPREFISKIRGH